MEASEPETKGFRWFQYICSQYFWLLPVVFAFIASFIWPYKIGSHIVYSSSAGSEWNSSSNPHVLAHVSDVHMSKFHKENAGIFKQVLETANHYKAKELLITGDLVYSFSNSGIIRESEQQLEEWEQYRTVISDYVDKFPFILDIPGNHDMFNIWDINSSNFLFLDYSLTYTRENTKTIEDFQVRYFNHDGYGFIAINPYTFPTIRNPFHIWVQPTRELLDSIERMIELHPNSVLLSHYPANMWEDTRSSSGKTFKEIVSGPGVLTFLSGHSHPEKPMFMHYLGGGMDVIGPASVNGGSFDIITDDNGRLGYHQVIATEEKPKVFITYPLPYEQQVSRQPFSERETEVRAIVYDDQDHNANIQASGCVSGKLEFQREIEDGVSLYSMPLVLDSGKHTINFSGDINNSFDFVVGEELHSLNITPLEFGRTFSTIVVLSGIVWIISLVITFPIFTFCESIENWIECKVQHIEPNRLIKILAVTIGSPLMIRERLSKIPMTARIILFTMCIYPIILPTFIINCENHFGFIWSFGYYIGGYNRFEDFASLYTLIYLIINVAIPACTFSSLGVSKFSPAFIIDYIFAGICIGANIFMLINYGTQTCGFPYLLISPGFVLAPLVWLTTLIVYTIKRYTKSPSLDYLVQKDDITSV